MKLSDVNPYNDPRFNEKKYVVNQSDLKLDDIAPCKDMYYRRSINNQEEQQQEQLFSTRKSVEQLIDQLTVRQICLINSTSELNDVVVGITGLEMLLRLRHEYL